MATSEDRVCIFLSRLPREIRDEIYRYSLVVNPEHRRLQPCPWRWAPKNEKFEGCSILATCKQIYLESSPIFYRENGFILETCDLERLSKPPFNTSGSEQLPSPLRQMRIVWLRGEDLTQLSKLEMMQRVAKSKYDNASGSDDYGDKYINTMLTPLVEAWRLRDDVLFFNVIISNRRMFGAVLWRYLEPLWALRRVKIAIVSLHPLPTWAVSHCATESKPNHWERLERSMRSQR